MQETADIAMYSVNAWLTGSVELVCVGRNMSTHVSDITVLDKWEIRPRQRAFLLSHTNHQTACETTAKSQNLSRLVDNNTCRYMFSVLYIHRAKPIIIHTPGKF